MRGSPEGVRLKLTEFDRVTEERGWGTDAERCRQLHIPAPTMSSIRAGNRTVGSRTIHRIMRRIDVPYLTLFEGADTAEVA